MSSSSTAVCRLDPRARRVRFLRGAPRAHNASYCGIRGPRRNGSGWRQRRLGPAARINPALLLSPSSSKDSSFDGGPLFLFGGRDPPPPTRPLPRVNERETRVLFTDSVRRGCSIDRKCHFLNTIDISTSVFN